LTLDPLNALSPEIGSPRTLSTRLTAPKEEPAAAPIKEKIKRKEKKNTNSDSDFKLEL
jgi:hypothetical protein